MNVILIIGGNGFIGKNLINFVGLNGFTRFTKMIVLTRSKPSESDVKFDNVEFHIGDFADQQVLDDLFARFNFDAVFHFANTIVPSSTNDRNVQDLYENVVPTIQLMDTMKRSGCSFLLYLSSGGAVYGNFTEESLHEDHSCNPISSYGITKLTIENYIQLYHRLFGLDYLVLRVSNPYGKFHTSQRQGIINISTRRALKQEPVVVWGNGEQTKDYIYVEDIVWVIWELYVKGIRNEVFNVGSGMSVSLNSLLKRIAEVIPTIDVKYEKSIATDVSFFQLNIDKLKKSIDFNPTDLVEGLNKTLKWEKEQIIKKD